MTVAARVDDGRFQSAFGSLLLGRSTGDGADLPALAAAPGLAVYRNTVARGLVDALAANFPTVRSLVGDDAFHEAARAHALTEPPRAPSLALYGAAFPAFLARWLDRHGAAEALPYLVDVARLDRLWTESHLAADAPSSTLAALAATPPEALLARRFRPHPAARRFASEATPAFTVWRRHREGSDLAEELSWQAEAALLTRPVDTVRWRPLLRSDLPLLDALCDGSTFGAALAHALDPAAAAASLAGWIDAGAFLADPEASP